MNITYLLGAGASYNALPVVNQINDRLKEFKSILTRTIDFPNFTPQSGKRIDKYLLNYGNEKIESSSKHIKKDMLNEMREAVQWLIDENSKHFSIDTFAKKLYLQKEFQLLQKLKITLCCFFVYLQNDSLDSRYDSFFASVLDDLRDLPNNLKFLSWNYDYQLEKAFSNFVLNQNLQSNQNALNVCSKGIKSSDSNLINKFSVFKLNGTTSLLNNGQNINILDNLNEDDDVLFDNIITYYYFAIYHKIPLTLSFAWEEDSNNYINSVTECIKNTDILIVIGYSFPFFNRKIDKHLLNNMSQLKRIYIQDPFNGESIEERINSLLPKEIFKPIQYKQVKMTDQFYIPIEF